MILHAMNIQVCTISKSHTATSTQCAGSAPIPPAQPTSVYPSASHSGSYTVEPLSPKQTWPTPYTCQFKDLVPARSVVPDPGIPVINEDNAMSLLDLNMTDNLGRTALHWAAVTDQPDMLGCLLEAGASLDVQTTCDETPLALAAREGAFSACRLLLVAGANPELADYLDRTPKQLAQAAGYEEIVRLFEASAHPDPAMLLNPGSGRQMGFPQVSSITWSHRSYSQARLISTGQERFDSTSHSHSSLMFPPGLVSKEPPRCATNENTSGKIEALPGVSSGSTICGDSKKFRDIDPPFLTTANNPYTTMVNNEFSPVNFFELEALHCRSTIARPLRCDSGTLSPPRNYMFYAYPQTALFDPNDLDPQPSSTYPRPDSNQFETGLGGPVPGEAHITSSDSESPNHWSSSPSDSSPKHQYRQRCPRKTAATSGVRQTESFTNMFPITSSNMNITLSNRSCALSANIICENGNTVTRTGNC